MVCARMASVNVMQASLVQTAAQHVRTYVLAMVVAAVASVSVSRDSVGTHAAHSYTHALDPASTTQS